MKKIIFLLLIISNLLTAQDKNCEFEVNEETDSTVTKVLPQRMISEAVFGNKTEILSFKLFVFNGNLGLNFQLFEKNSEFIPATCIDANTKIIIQMNNSKEISLVNSLDTEACNTLQYEATSKMNYRILDGFFYFIPDNFNDLKTEKINLVRIIGSTGERSFVINKVQTSELTKEISTPETYFMDYLKCFGIN